jgi:hypothetical protein
MVRPTARGRELETLLARLRKAGNVQLSYDMWERWGAQHATPAYRAEMEGAFAEANREHAAAKSALEALVAATWAEAPAEIAAWADAHQAYLAELLDQWAKQPESTGTQAFVATRERAEWAEVHAGTRVFVEENVFYVPTVRERHRCLFGVDPDTLEPVLTANDEGALP